MHRMRWVLAMLLALLPFFGMIPPRTAEAAPRAAIATDHAAVRTGPSTSAPSVDQLDPGDVFGVVGTVEGEQVSGENGVWLATDQGHYVYSGVATMQSAGASYIDVDRETHTALAIEDGTIVHRAPVVLGRPGWRTPVGAFTIVDQVASETMDSTELGIPVDSPGGFSYPHVLYVQYVDGGFALHYNYWAPASDFGHADSSHGCVGMQLSDAKFFWDFAYVGTQVFVHD